MEAPVLAHFNPDKPIILECDALDYTIAGIILQHGDDNEIHLIAFFSRSMQPAELNYVLGVGERRGSENVRCGEGR
jgi:hypothetical protein